MKQGLDHVQHHVKAWACVNTGIQHGWGNNLAWLTTRDTAFRSCPSDFSKVDVVLLSQVFGGGRGKNLIAGRRLLPHT